MRVRWVGEGIDDGMTEKAEMLFPYFNVLTPFFFPPFILPF